jgi:type IX secretion system PorP/SprF family membrane protein
MKYTGKFLLMAVMLLPLCGYGQSYPHYSMFMFNKLIYNPAYAGNKNITTVNAAYRNQWTGIEGAPRTFNVAIDGPVGNYMQPFRKMAVGLSVNSERIGVTDNTNIMGYYAFRIPLNKTVLSLGLQGGISLYSARYSELNARDEDQRLQNNVHNAVLPNFGPGIYWTGSNFYIGASVPNLLENYYDKDNKGILANDGGKQVRSYFLSGGYVFSVSEHVKLEPQVLVRYAGNGVYQLPWNSDFNLSCILYDRLMVGATYRTDQSIAGVVHVQATRYINIGYSYDYTASGLSGYNNGTHEVVLGFDFVRDRNRYANPRFIKSF